MIHSVSPTPLRRRRQSFSPELPPPRLFYWKVVGLLNWLVAVGQVGRGRHAAQPTMRHPQT